MVDKPSCHCQELSFVSNEFPVDMAGLYPCFLPLLWPGTRMFFTTNAFNRQIDSALRSGRDSYILKYISRICEQSQAYMVCQALGDGHLTTVGS